MNKLLIEMCKYAGIITENVKPKSLGLRLKSLIANYENKNWDKESIQKEVFKVITNYCYKDWVKVVPFTKEKLLKINITPMDWKPSDGNIDNVVSNGDQKVKQYFKNWIKFTINNELKKYPNYRLWIEKRAVS